MYDRTNLLSIISIFIAIEFRLNFDSNFYESSFVFFSHPKITDFSRFWHLFELYYQFEFQLSISPISWIEYDLIFFWYFKVQLIVQ